MGGHGITKTTNYINYGFNAHNMNGTIILFRMPPKTPSNVVNKFCKEFYGQDTSSHRGKYQYRRHGILDDIPHHRIIRQVVIVRTEDAASVVEFLEKYDALVHTRIVELTCEDLMILKR